MLELNLLEIRQLFTPEAEVDTVQVVETPVTFARVETNPRTSVRVPR